MFSKPLHLHWLNKCHTAVVRDYYFKEEEDKVLEAGVIWSKSHGRVGAKLGLKPGSLEFKFTGPPLPSDSIIFAFKFEFWNKVVKQNENVT